MVPTSQVSSDDASLLSPLNILLSLTCTFPQTLCVSLLIGTVTVYTALPLSLFPILMVVSSLDNLGLEKVIGERSQ